MSYTTTPYTAKPRQDVHEHPETLTQPLSGLILGCKGSGKVEILTVTSVNPWELPAGEKYTQHLYCNDSGP